MPENESQNGARVEPDSSLRMALLFVLITVVLGSLLSGRMLSVLAGVAKFPIVLLLLGLLLFLFSRSINPRRTIPPH